MRTALKVVVACVALALVADGAFAQERGQRGGRGRGGQVQMRDVMPELKLLVGITSEQEGEVSDVVKEFGTKTQELQQAMRDKQRELFGGGGGGRRGGGGRGLSEEDQAKLTALQEEQKVAIDEAVSYRNDRIVALLSGDQKGKFEEWTALDEARRDNRMLVPATLQGSMGRLRLTDEQQPKIDACFESCEKAMEELGETATAKQHLELSEKLLKDVKGELTEDQIRRLEGGGRGRGRGGF